MNKKDKKGEGREGLDERLREMAVPAGRQDFAQEIIESGGKNQGVKKDAGTPLGVEGEVIAGGRVAAFPFIKNINSRKTGGNQQ